MTPTLCPKCSRVYSTIRKNGVFRVKFYKLDTDTPNTLPLYSSLKQLGWSKVSVQIVRSPFGAKIPSLQILATKG
jgi:hypothetical protein